MPRVGRAVPPRTPGTGAGSWAPRGPASAPRAFRSAPRFLFSLFFFKLYFCLRPALRVRSRSRLQPSGLGRSARLPPGQLGGDPPHPRPRAPRDAHRARPPPRSRAPRASVAAAAGRGLGGGGARRRRRHPPPPAPAGPCPGGDSAQPRPGRFRRAPQQHSAPAPVAAGGPARNALGARLPRPAPRLHPARPGRAPLGGRRPLPPAAVSAAPPGLGGRAWPGAADAAAPPPEAASREARPPSPPGPERAPMEAPGPAKAAAADPDPPESPGGTPDGAPAYRLQDFDTLATVGTGTFGRVQLVRQKTAKRFFALKVMSIPDVIRLKQEQHVHNEKSVLKEVSHPFLVKLFWTCHDERFLYMLMEFVPGGELFSYLRNRGRFSSNAGLFYSAEIVCAIEYLHSREIVYRDLKPENILLDRDGHIKLTDFGFAKKLVDKTWTLCGTPEYLAPEVIQSRGHGRAVDWWALGILIFEMLSGFPPFFDDNPFGIYQKILAGKIDFPRHLDFNVKDLVKKLLVVDRTRRLGNMKNGADDVKRHRWFRTVDWEAVPQRKLKPPIVPKVCGEGDTSNFEAYPENDWNTAPPVSPKDLEVFKNF
ncbi:cAMP-dependent protein kinase catalytic subunit PRKX [Hipposideros larvatus]